MENSPEVIPTNSEKLKGKISVYVTSLRTKEIGVRKVLGASVNSVVVELSKDFTKMILIAFILAVQVACYVMEK